LQGKTNYGNELTDSSLNHLPCESQIKLSTEIGVGVLFDNVY